ncbi:MAG: hypothetical protein ACRETZ_10945 [Steroidobacteraceae bacterium]
MLIVENDQDAVEADLTAGRLRCSSCGVGVLGRWGFARRRVLRDGQELRPRRSMCSACSKTHVLLADVCLLRRRDSAAAIGAALSAVVVDRQSVEDVSVLNGVPLETLRGWVRRLRHRAVIIGAHFRRWLVALAPGRPPLEAAASCSIDALEAIGAAARVASVAIAVRPPWSWASRLSAGGLLSNTSSPWPAPD